MIMTKMIMVVFVGDSSLRSLQHTWSLWRKGDGRGVVDIPSFFGHTRTPFGVGRGWLRGVVTGGTLPVEQNRTEIGTSLADKVVESLRPFVGS